MLPDIRSGLSNLEHLNRGIRCQNQKKRAVEGLNASLRDFNYGRVRVQNTSIIAKELLLQVSWELICQMAEATLEILDERWPVKSY